jgi:replicative superfamily II helicase
MAKTFEKDKSDSDATIYAGFLESGYFKADYVNKDVTKFIYEANTEEVVPHYNGNPSKQWGFAVLNVALNHDVMEKGPPPALLRAVLELRADLGRLCAALSSIVSCKDKIEDFCLRLKYGAPPVFTPLLRIEQVGYVRAKALLDKGIASAKHVVNHQSSILIMFPEKIAKTIIASAKKIDAGEPDNGKLWATSNEDVNFHKWGKK